MDSVSSQHNLDDNFNPSGFRTSECRSVRVCVHTRPTVWRMLKPTKARKKLNLDETKVFE